jgi:CBS domain containing-hemolysin-like protein
VTRHAAFWPIVAQIVVLDAVFSLDAVITAVGMVDELSVMMIAVIFSIGIMIVASKPLTRFVNAHPTVIMLCLGFLMMIGFSLTAEGLGFHIPKGYLYAAIGFSILIELFNQWPAPAASAVCNSTDRCVSAPPMPCCACWAGAGWRLTRWARRSPTWWRTAASKWCSTVASG